MSCCRNLKARAWIRRWDIPGQDWFENFFVQGLFVEGLERIPVERTEMEVAFIVETLGLPKGARILDLCCGIGRHSVALAERGYQMAGLDLDERALAIAQSRAQEARVDIVWHQADMRRIPYSEELDGVINVFGSWGYYDTDEKDAEVLGAVAAALTQGGLFLLEIINRDNLFRRYQPNTWTTEANGNLVLTRYDLDLTTSRHRATELVFRPDGQRFERWHTYRFYTLTEVIRMMRDVGLLFRKAWGGYDASPYTLESRRMIVLAEKTG